MKKTKLEINVDWIWAYDNEGDCVSIKTSVSCYNDGSLELLVTPKDFESDGQHVRQINIKTKELRKFYPKAKELIIVL